MIDWIATHHELILHTCVVMFSLIGAVSITYAGWWFVSSELEHRKEVNKVMAEYRRKYPDAATSGYQPTMDDFLGEEDEDEVIRRII